jgi:acid phosphatase
MEPADAHYLSAADFKAPQRQTIESEGYTIVANMGDQPSDLDGGFAERTYLLPNPFYRIP